MFRLQSCLRFARTAGGAEGLRVVFEVVEEDRVSLVWDDVVRLRSARHDAVVVALGHHRRLITGSHPAVGVATEEGVATLGPAVGVAAFVPRSAVVLTGAGAGLAPSLADQCAASAGTSAKWGIWHPTRRP